jgi:hypothetical protein
MQSLGPLALRLRPFKSSKSFRQYDRVLRIKPSYYI